MPKACLAKSAQQVKKALNIPVMTVGRINDPLVANEILINGQADLVCIGRGLLADPEMPNKAREGRLDESCGCSSQYTSQRFCPLMGSKGHPQQALV